MSTISIENSAPIIKIVDNKVIVTLANTGPQGRPGSGAIWGNITGTLSNQTDLWNALQAAYYFAVAL